MTDKDIAEIYRDMELELVESMKRNLGLHLAEESDTMLEYPQWQAIKLKELRKYQKQNKAIIKRRLRGLPSDVAKQLRDELKQGHESEIKKFWKYIGEKKFRSAVTMNESFFNINTRLVDNLISEIHGSMHTAEHAALRMMNDTYRDVIAKAALFQANGVATEAKAVDMATKDFLNRGLNCIEYRDGRRVNIADYCSMAVRTAQQRAYMMGEGEFRKSIGETLIIISRHNTACELCRPFERKVLIDDVYSGGKQSDGDYMLLSQAMQMGLFHPGCCHGHGTYYPELEDINGYETVDNKLNDYGSQQANEAHIDNMIQRYKRLTLGSFDPDNVRKYQERLEYWQNQKTELAKPENVDNDGESGIIKAKENTVVNGKNVVGEFELREGFEYAIDDILDYQGYNGAPKIVNDKEAFDKLVKEDHFIAERTLRADNVDILNSYCDQLLCRNGEDYFYVNCGAGGAQYGQGMYCAADYTKNITDLSMFTHEIDHYGSMNGASQSRTLWLTMDKSAKILVLPNGEDASEYISNLYIDEVIKREAKKQGIEKEAEQLLELMRKQSDDYQDYLKGKITSEKLWENNDIYNAQIESLYEQTPKLREIKKNANKSLTYAPDKKHSGDKTLKDPGVLAAEMGYDAINAEGHGTSGSYTVLLNRTKAIFFGGGNYAQ